MIGSGGSVLTLPILIYLPGQDEKVAIAGSLAIVGLAGTIGSPGGNSIACRLPREKLKAGFAGFLILMAGFIFYQAIDTIA